MDNDNKVQIQQILNIIKISSLAFPAIAFLQYYSKKPDFLSSITHELLIIAILLVILVVYSLWVYLQNKIEMHSSLKRLIELKADQITTNEPDAVARRVMELGLADRT